MVGVRDVRTHFFVPLFLRDFYLFVNVNQNRMQSQKAVCRSDRERAGRVHRADPT